MRVFRGGQRRTRGIVLLEVLLSVSIIAVGVVVPLRAIGASARAQARLEERSVARRLAEGQLAVLRVSDMASRQGETEGRFDAPFDQYSWTVESQSGGHEAPFALVVLSIWGRENHERRPVYSVQTLVH